MYIDVYIHIYIYTHTHVYIQAVHVDVAAEWSATFAAVAAARGESCE